MRAECGHGVTRDAAVQRDEVHVVHTVALDDIEHAVGRHAHHVAAGGIRLRECLVDRHGTEGHRALGPDRAADLVDVSAGGEVHHRVGAGRHRRVELLQLAGGVGVVR